MWREQELMIIRAVNFCDMNRDKLNKIAIDKTKTIGEIYIELMKENFINFWKKENNGK